EWVGHSGFPKVLLIDNKPTTTVAAKNNSVGIITGDHIVSKPANGWLKKFLFILVACTVAFLIYNFTRIKWEKAAALNITAARPANSPALDVDSLIQTIENSRGQKFDKVTNTNFRIRNTWPDRIVLRMDTDHDTNNGGNRYYNAHLAIDNSTGYNIDNAVVKLTVWKNNEVSSADTFVFKNISYAAIAKRDVANSYRGDSISISFQSIKSKSFNFCYSDDKKSNYGNLNDRWFCKE
ncbi:MAG: hypothetical protein JJE22_08920, partial [Bacteroidia bacterium]|nr:hypothetical protein [Bacteroidia bacterium]